ncbi:MAG: HypC/HybG/HupF family hydrogenase formation chaperone [Atribacterota bacterium]|nr:HypC/HybG/HupF family hydrogenase formation chaperone [Atribacterota bacterium]MDD5497347.1 HypC/HybG/HupF family hydrogenase formation chaperone [Atribacterota bacterium]
MCLAIPGKIIKKINHQEAEVLLGSIKKVVRIDLLPEVEVGDYVLIHAGYAISKINPSEAREISQAWEGIQS